MQRVRSCQLRAPPKVRAALEATECVGPGSRRVPGAEDENARTEKRQRKRAVPCFAAALPAEHRDISAMTPVLTRRKHRDPLANIERCDIPTSLSTTRTGASSETCGAPTRHARHPRRQTLVILSAPRDPSLAQPSSDPFKTLGAPRRQAPPRSEALAPTRAISPDGADPPPPPARPPPAIMRRARARESRSRLRHPQRRRLKPSWRGLSRRSVAQGRPWELWNDALSGVQAPPRGAPGRIGAATKWIGADVTPHPYCRSPATIVSERECVVTPARTRHAAPRTVPWRRRLDRGGADGVALRDRYTNLLLPPARVITPPAHDASCFYYGRQASRRLDKPFVLFFFARGGASGIQKSANQQDPADVRLN
ncbi:hypothetical protein HYPSUDRAFT_207521 [Hypholoma sublateritium FD-334 SS-4]|uniref:Uncharacterized protein n=1 Tax=Hypholoma sublateritium (strain FD-334 SS-4) TaxID=945553 RepID=A0A0D2N9Q3_HYPSF|nr:hypothetical protein HYPSUDRAFT_207521 [Hypholoma sublateritium FD-334 SS-4]